MIYWVNTSSGQSVSIACVREVLVGGTAETYAGELYTIKPFAGCLAAAHEPHRALVTPVFSAYMHSLSSLSDTIVGPWGHVNFRQYAGEKN